MAKKNADGGSVKKKAVLLFSGGLDTSTICKWLQAEHGWEIVTLTLDIGQHEDLSKVAEKARKIGAVSHYTVDVREEFVRACIIPAIKANALYQGIYPVGTSIARPLIAKYGVEVARKEGAVAVAHGCTGKGNDQVRFDIIIKSMAPDLQVLVPVREWNMGRDQEIAYCKAHGVSVNEKKSQFSVDENLWGRSAECGVLEDPWNAPPEDAFGWTAAPERTPNAPEYVQVDFKKGVPVSMLVESAGKRVDGTLELILSLNKLAGAHGVGRLDHMEDRVVGLKSREVYEYPAAVVLISAHRDLEKLVSTTHTNSFKEGVDAMWARLAYSGLWTDPLIRSLNAFIDSVNEKVTGTVRVMLHKGAFRVVGRKSANAIYDFNLSSYNIDSKFDQKNSVGFIELWGLQTRMSNAISEKARASRSSTPQVGKEKEKEQVNIGLAKAKKKKK